MKEALAMHPEWNGDWQMPANIRKAEIDIRNGSLIRELDALADASPSPTPTPKPRPKDPDLDQYYEEPLPMDPVEMFVTKVPPEFRRIELFVIGTVPNRAMLPITEETADESEQEPRPSPTPAPVNETWQDGTEPPEPRPPSGQERAPASAAASGTVTVMICSLSGMRANKTCPTSESKIFRSGTAPKDSCTFHR